MQEQPLLSPEQLARLHEDARIAAEANYEAIGEESGWLENLPSLASKIAGENASLKSKYLKFRDLADKINAAVMPHSPCNQGCSHCCNIAVVISAHEAERIASLTKRPLSKSAIQSVEDPEGKKFFGQPCPFLAEGRCSIYEERPLSCRIHHSLGAAPTLCDTRLKVSESVVPSLGLPGFWNSYGLSMGHLLHADIREFFNNGE